MDPFKNEVTEMVSVNSVMAGNLLEWTTLSYFTPHSIFIFMQQLNAWI